MSAGQPVEQQRDDGGPGVVTVDSPALNLAESTTATDRHDCRDRVQLVR